jgi:hypothetical protein
MSSGSGARNVVLVHGGFVDGSGWQAVHDLPATVAALITRAATATQG